MSVPLIFLMKVITILIVLQCQRTNGSVNVARGCHTNSTPYLKGNPKWNSTTTVDGNINQKLYCAPCLHTQQKDAFTPAFLTVDLGKTCTINRVEIYFVRDATDTCSSTTDDDEVKRRSVKYAVKILEKNRSNGTVCYKDNTTDVAAFDLTQNKTCIGTGRYISIIQTQKSSSEGVTGPILELCEFKVFGCGKGKFGPNCEYTCSYCKNSTCDPDHGTCLNGCNNGLYGPYCTMQQFVSHGTTTKSGSHLTYKGVSWNAEKAVDGCIDTNMFCDCCLHTNQSAHNTPEFLTLNLNQIYDIRKVEIYFASYNYSYNICANNTGRSLEIQKRSKGYNIWIANNTEQSQKCYEDNTDNVYFFNPHQINPCIGRGQYINITQSHVSDERDVHGPILEICEVKVYGCLSGYYGDNCEHQCPIHCNGDVCTSNGMCLNGCKAGWRGSDCTECSENKYGTFCNISCGNCENQTKCDSETGHCPNAKCEPGYRDIMCQEKCWNGTYGQNCSSKCGNCKGNVTCDYVSGSCPNGYCELGFRGKSCQEECPNGTYGNNCSKKCGECRDNVCSKRTGICPLGKCKKGFNGTFCNKTCPDGTFGYNCEELCGNCKDREACNKTSGECPEELCDRGFNGSFCNESCIPGRYGFNCNESCGHCKDNATCDTKNGSCKQGLCEKGYNGSLCIEECTNGTYGYNCLQTCGTCRNGAACDKKNGDCPSALCDRGFNGSLCNETCSDGTFGYNCNETCGYCRNNSACDKKYGNCTDELCKEGFDGSNCVTECADGYYGYNCIYNCGKCADQTVCNKTTGICPNGVCGRGVNGSKCDQVCNGTYGYNCNETCGHCQKDLHCDARYGNCSQSLCIWGYTGLYCDVKASRQTDSDNNIPVIGGGIAAVLLVAVLVIVIIIFLKRRKMSDDKSSQNNDHELSDIGTARTRKSRRNEQNSSGVYASAKKINSYMDIKDTQTKDADDEEIEQEYVNVQLGKRSDKDYQMPCRTLADIVKEKENDENKIFKEEFGTLPKGQLKPCEAAKMSSNMPKNRFKTTFPYDDTRIVLKTDGAKESDYVNANYIKDTNGRCTYIASQGPRTHTVVDMWRMVWQEEISCIVMLTNLQEKRIDKCAKYWPNVTCTEIYGQISIKTIKENIYGNYTIRVFKITNTQESGSRDISHYHYTTWPDHGVPESLDLVIFHNKVQRQAMSSSKSGAPLLVHCSAGIGRTGTFIALDALLSHSKDNDSVNIFQFVKHMREEDRMNMIQTVDQYVAIHHLLLEAIRTKYYPIPKSSFGEDVKRMSSTSSPANQNVFRRQISELNDLKPNYSDDDFTRGLHNQDRNIDPNILPVDRYMLYLTTFVKGRNDYINAITVPIQTALHSIVVTNVPKDNTTVDLIRLILDHGSFVVDLSGSTNGQKWYPDPSTTRSYNPFEVERSELKTSNIANVTESDCTIFQKQKDSEPLSIRLFESDVWPSNASDEDGIRTLCGLVRRVMLWNRTSTNGKLILVSKDGVTRCDVFCAVYNALEQLEMDEEVDMFNIVRQLQIRRPQFIQTMEEYKLCFDAVSYDLESNNESIYANV